MPKFFYFFDSFFNEGTSKMVTLAQRKIYTVSQWNAEINLLVETKLVNALYGHKTIIFGAIFSNVGNETETSKLASSLTGFGL